MMLPLRYFIMIGIFVAGLLPAGVYAQGAPGVNKDTINYSSTCVNTTIQFGSPIFDSLPFPSAVLWNFGDPGSGIYNTSRSPNPKHSFAAPGTYTVNLMVVNNTVDTVYIKGTISAMTPIKYSFGPDVYLCEGQDILLTAPIVPGARYAWNDDTTTRTDTLRVKQSGVYTV